MKEGNFGPTAQTMSVTPAHEQSFRLFFSSPPLLFFSSFLLLRPLRTLRDLCVRLSDFTAYIDNDPSRKSVLSSHTFTSTGWPRAAMSAAAASAGCSSLICLTTIPWAPNPAATA